MGAPVILNVYDLHDNSWIYWCGIGETVTPRKLVKVTLVLPFTRPFPSRLHGCASFDGM